MRALGITVSFGLLATLAWALVSYTWFTTGTLNAVAILTAGLLSVLAIVMPAVTAPQQSERVAHWCLECRQELRAPFSCGFCLSCGRFYSQQAEKQWKSHV